MIRNVQGWTEKLGEDLQDDGWTRSQNMEPLNVYLSFDVLTDLCYGKSFNLLGSKDMRYVTHLIPAANRAVYEVSVPNTDSKTSLTRFNQIGYHPCSSVLRKVLFGNPVGDLLGGQMIRDNISFQQTSRMILAERRKRQEVIMNSDEPPSRKDFFHYLFHEKDTETGRGYSDGELASESNLLIIAGSDTTSLTLSAAFFYLLRNPQALSKLRLEIVSNFTNLEDIRYVGTGLPTLPYLRACIDETLRQSPPVAAHIPREVLPGGAMIDGVFYPGGTVLGVSIYALHHNEEYFPEPFKFLPERWIVDEAAGTTAEDVERAHSAFAPFSVGSRGCIGKNLAYMELSLALARMVWMYDIREGDHGVVDRVRTGKQYTKEMEAEYPTKDFFVGKFAGPMVEFKLRKAE